MNKFNNFYEAYDYYYVPFWQTTAFRIMVVVCVILFICMTLWIVLRRKKKLLSPSEQALLKLRKLDLESCIDKRAFKSFYFTLTQVLKEYLFLLYGWKTMDKTDEELIPYLKKQHFEASLLSALAKMLGGALWVKFADEEIIKMQAKKDLETAIRIINETTPKNDHS